MKSFFSKIFSIKNSVDLSRKIITILGIKIKIKTVDIILKDFITTMIAKEVYSAIEVEKLHSKTFPKFKACHYNENVAVLGSGPTLEYYNNELDTINIALNHTFSLKNYKFTYSFALDSGIFLNWPNYIEDIKKSNCINFLGNPLDINANQFPEIANSDKYNIYRYYTSNRSGCYGIEFGKIFFKDLEVRPLLDAYSVVFSALQFAIYTHPKKLYLIGLDTSNNGHYFSFGGGDGKYLTENMIKIYKKFKTFAQIHYPDVEIISVNPVGLKGLFKDVYTSSYINKHPELKNKNAIILR